MRAARPGPRLGALLFLSCALLAAGCATSNPSALPGPTGDPNGATIVTVTLTDAGCVPDRATVAAGPVTFSVVNDGGGAVSEVELVAGDRILGEKENLAPGLSGRFTLDLPAGDYSLSCPGAATPATSFVVTTAVNPGASGAVTTLLEQATSAYASYVRDQVAQLVAATKAFAEAVDAGDIARAKALYGPARVFYERIEPVAESFGDLDPAIDGRADGAATPADFTGFHRLEQALWETGDLAGMTPVATKLLADVTRLSDLVATESYQPAQLANGAAELLDEIAASKVTGEEERYSHLDLLDFQANLDGAKATFELLRPALEVVDPQLSANLVTQFDGLAADLAGYRSGDGFVPYTALDASETRALAQAVDALAEPMSEVAAKLVDS